MVLNIRGKARKWGVTKKVDIKRPKLTTSAILVTRKSTSSYNNV